MGAIYQSQLVLGTVFICNFRKFFKIVETYGKQYCFSYVFINLNHFWHFPLKSRRICQELPYRNQSELFTRPKSFSERYLFAIKKFTKIVQTYGKQYCFSYVFINLKHFSHFPLKSRRICQELPYRNHSELFTRPKSFSERYLFAIKKIYQNCSNLWKTI